MAKKWKISVTDNWSPFARNLRNINKKGLRKGLEWMEEEFERQAQLATKSWKPRSRPSWQIRTGQGFFTGAWQLTARTDDLPYLYVDLGVPRHDIPPSPLMTHFMVFRKNYLPKTVPNQPGRLLILGGLSFGPIWKARQVDHPGIKARNFTDTMLNRIEDELTSDVIPGLLYEYVTKFDPPPDSIEWVY